MHGVASLAYPPGKLVAANAGTMVGSIFFDISDSHSRPMAEVVVSD